MKEFHYVYKVTNLVNGMYYIGKHSTNKIDDNYFGSGNLLRKAFKKYRRKNFKKEIIQFCDTEQEAFDLESKLVTINIVKDRKSYNITVGGMGMRKGGKLSDQTKEKIRIAHTGRSFSVNTRKKLSEALTGKIVTDSAKENMSKTQRKRFKLRPHNRNKKVAQLEKETFKQLMIFDSVADANEHIGRIRNSDNIGACARGEVASSGGFYWKYI